MGGSSDHPSLLDLKYRLRWFILGKHSSAVFTENTNTEDTEEKCLLKPIESADDYCSLITRTIVGKLMKRIEIATDNFVESAVSLDEELEELLWAYEIKEDTNNESLKYIAGYVAYKYREKYQTALVIDAEFFSMHESYLKKKASSRN